MYISKEGVEFILVNCMESVVVSHKLEIRYAQIRPLISQP